MDAKTRAELVAKYKAGYDAITTALATVGDAALDRVPKDGSWTPRVVVHHVADSEMTSAIRLRRLLCEDNPTIVGYDEELFARRLYYTDRPIESSLAAIRSARETTAEILDRMADNDWLRVGTHTEMGAYSVGTWLEVYSTHCHEHANQILAATR